MNKRETGRSYNNTHITNVRDLLNLADCPAVSLDLCIYTAGGGNPLYREELLKQCSSVKNKAIGLIFFAELESCMHKADVKANKWRKKWWKPTEKCPKSAIFHPLAWIEVLKPHFRPSFQALIFGPHFGPSFQALISGPHFNVNVGLKWGGGSLSIQ